MKRALSWLVGFSWLIIATVEMVPAGIVQAVIPQAVPTANKIGNSTKFQLGSGSFTSGDCPHYDASGNLIDSGSSTCGGSMKQFASTTTAGPDDTASETSLIGTVVGSTTIFGGALQDGSLLNLRLAGQFNLPNPADDLTLRVKLGSTVFASVLVPFSAIAATASNVSWDLQITFNARGNGAGGSLIGNGLFQTGNPGGAGNVIPPVSVGAASPTAIDFTANLLLDVTAQWNAAQAGESLLCTNSSVLINK